jgi:hypothetical protein
MNPGTEQRKLASIIRAGGTDAVACPAGSGAAEGVATADCVEASQSLYAL